ncbi:unnamed protein product [Trichobilharzia szidati]|nr:unnamed protein product [Trichobilharzia szidati]CAH8856368.1 unnamed protein product [Trichobilharzia szidati]
MDFFQLDKVRCSIQSDHCYAFVNKTVGDEDEEIFNLSSYHSQEESILDVGGPSTADSIGENVCQDDILHSVYTSEPELNENIHLDQPKDDCHTWVPCEKKHLLKIISSLRKIIRIEHFYSSQSSDGERLQCQKELCVNRAANNLRRILAELSWHVEKCFSLHLWCVKNLPQKLLSLYGVVYSLLWQKSKVNPLLKVLNSMLKERYADDTAVDQFLSSLQLSNDDADVSKDSTKQDPLQSSSKPTIIKPIHPISFNRSTSNDEIVLVCMTFPAPRDSRRLRKLLNLLGEIGRVNLESQDEQMCDSMRLRLRLFVRRVIGVLDECKNESVYLVGFGVGTLLMLLSAIHILSLDSHLAGNRTSIGGIICLGVPLLGLRGAGSRLGGYKEALEFRKKLLAARQSQVLCRNGVNSMNIEYGHKSKYPISNGSTDNYSIPSTFDLLVVGGADFLLRMRPSACKRWCTTQDRVDLRIVKAIKNFIHKTKMLSTSSSSSMEFMLSPAVSSSGRSRFDFMSTHPL